MKHVDCDVQIDQAGLVRVRDRISGIEIMQIKLSRERLGTLLLEREVEAVTAFTVDPPVMALSGLTPSHRTVTVRVPNTAFSGLKMLDYALFAQYGPPLAEGWMPVYPTRINGTESPGTPGETTFKVQAVRYLKNGHPLLVPPELWVMVA